MKRKKVLRGSKKKVTHIPKSFHMARHRKTNNLRKPTSVTKKKTKRKARKLAVTRPIWSRIQSSQDFAEYERKLDYLNGKIDELVKSVNSFRRYQEANHTGSLREEKPLSRNSDVEQQEFSGSAPNLAPPKFSTKPESSEVKLVAERTSLEQELDRLAEDESAAKARLSKLNAEFDEIQGKVDALQKYYIAQNQSLDGELEARRKAIHQRIEDERTKAEAEIMLLLRQRDESRELVRNLSEEKDSLRKEIEFAKALMTLIRNPESVKEPQLEIMSEKFEQARMARSKGTRNSTNSRALIAWQRLISEIEELAR